MPDGKANTTITITLPADIADKIQEVGHDKGCSVSGVLRDALSVYLDNWKWYDTLLRNQENARSLGINPDDADRLIEEYREEVRAEKQHRD